MSAAFVMVMVLPMALVTAMETLKIVPVNVAAQLNLMSAAFVMEMALLMVPVTAMETLKIVPVYAVDHP
jgi:hypothetical protein